MAWIVEKVENWGWDGESRGLLVHDGGDSIFVPDLEIEDFLTELGKVIVVDFAGLDVKGYIKLLIRAWRESRTASVQERG